jgi:molecular chaperone DnaK
MGFIRHHNENFSKYAWNDSGRARQLLNNGLEKLTQNPTKEELHPIVISLIDLLPPEQQPSGDNSVLVG